MIWPCPKSLACIVSYWLVRQPLFCNPSEVARPTRVESMEGFAFSNEGVLKKCDPHRWHDDPLQDL